MCFFSLIFPGRECRIISWILFLADPLLSLSSILVPQGNVMVCCLATCSSVTIIFLLQKLFELFNKLSIFKGLFHLIGLIAVYDVINRNIKDVCKTLQDIGRRLDVFAFIPDQLGMRDTCSYSRLNGL